MNLHQFSCQRADLAFIAHWVDDSSHVLDLGCGDGVMLDYLQSDRCCTGYGIEIDSMKIAQCVQRGVSVLQQDVTTALASFDDNTFDTVLCLSALQMMTNVEETLREIARVGRQAIISFPNFAYWRHRLAILCGRMPVSKALPHQWYNTPNLRHASIDDFALLANRVGLDVYESFALKRNGRQATLLPNLRGSMAVFRFQNR